MGSNGRQLTNTALMSKILLLQEGRCGYCNSSLWNEQIEWDHFVPWIYTGNSGGEDNWVASCVSCNRRKSSRVFRNETDVAKFCAEMVSLHGSFGEGFEEGANAWRLELMDKAQKTPTRTSG